MSIEKVKDYFEKIGATEKILEFSVSSATVALAAEALGCEPERIAKSLTFKEGEQGCIMVVCAGDAKVDNAKFKATFGLKAKMPAFEEVEDLCGYAAGGVCPFDVNENVKVYLDVSLKRFNTVFPACGSSNSAVELTLEKLERYSNFINWVDVCKAWEE